MYNAKKVKHIYKNTKHTEQCEEYYKFYRYIQKIFIIFGEGEERALYNIFNQLYESLRTCLGQQAFL